MERNDIIHYNENEKTMEKEECDVTELVKVWLIIQGSGKTYDLVSEIQPISSRFAFRLTKTKLMYVGFLYIFEGAKLLQTMFVHALKTQFQFQLTLQSHGIREYYIGEGHVPKKIKKLDKLLNTMSEKYGRNHKSPALSL